jgi:putative glutamine amidotransferase
MELHTFPPLIGISGGLIPTNAWSPSIVGHRRSYVEAVLQAGGLPVILPPLTDLRALRALYERLDGVVLAGGDDIDPIHYGEKPHPRLGAVSPERDAAEIQLARWAFADDLPLLGICRGAQMINVARGGTLWQDLPSALPTSLDHYASAALQRWDVMDHPITLNADSRLAGMLGTTAIGLNSLHHQAVKQLGAGLRAVGSAPDDVIEAIEADDAAFVVGIQGHPETLWQTAEPRWSRLFAAFTAAAGQRALGHRQPRPDAAPPGRIAYAAARSSALVSATDPPYPTRGAHIRPQTPP